MFFKRVFQILELENQTIMGPVDSLTFKLVQNNSNPITSKDLINQPVNNFFESLYLAVCHPTSLSNSQIEGLKAGTIQTPFYR